MYVNEKQHEISKLNFARSNLLSMNYISELRWFIGYDFLHLQTIILSLFIKEALV